MQKDSAEVKISSKVVGGYFFDSPCMYNMNYLFVSHKNGTFYFGNSLAKI